MSAAKVFCVAFHKTGTTSLHEFLLSAGLTSCHVPHRVDGIDYMKKVAAVADDAEKVVDVLAPAIARFDAHCDVPYPGLYEVLARRYPDARFILITRELEGWWSSLSVQWSLGLLSEHRLTPFEYVQYRPYIGGRQTICGSDKGLLIEAHRQHVIGVKRRIEADRLLVFDLQDADKAGKLRAFLQLDSAGEFPHAKQTDFRRSVRQLVKNVKRRVKRRLRAGR